MPKTSTDNRRKQTAARMHPRGYVMPSRGDGLHWLECTECGRPWAENDRGSFVRGSRVCRVLSGQTSE